MNRLMTLAAAGAVAVASSAGVAFAQSVENDAKIKITANEPEICGFVPGSADATGFFPGAGGTTDTASINDIKLIGSAESFADAPSGFEFRVNIDAKCNTVVEVKARCINGGELVNADAEARSSTLVTRLPYSVRFEFDFPSESNSFSPSSCPTGFTDLPNLSGKADFDSTAGDDDLTVVFNPATTPGTRAAGDFKDTVEIELGPKS